MAALLSTQDEATGVHFLEDVPVPDRRFRHGDSCVLHGDLEAEIGHHGGDNRAVCQGLALLLCNGQHGEYVITIDDGSVGGYGKASVCVAIVGNPHIGIAALNRGDQRFHVGRPATVIDVPAIWLRVNSRYLSSGTLECPGAHLKRGAIRTIDDNP